MTRCPRCQRRLAVNGACEVHGRPTTVVLAVEPELEVTAPAGWRIAGHLATGGMAQVYALDRSGANAVLKWGRWRDRETRARFEHEATVLRALGPPITPGYLEHGTIDQWPYLILEHVAGETLASWMSRTGARGGLGEIVAILSRLASAITHVHAAGYVHRDLKPENIVIGARGARLLDFGLAKLLRAPASSTTQVGAVVGTVHYVAPEQIRGLADERADIYAFGVIAYEMLTGVPPFVGERRAIEYQHQVVRPAPLRDARDVPRELDELVLRCLAKEPGARPAALETELRGVLGSLATIRGVGATTSAAKPIGRQAQAALVWIEDADPVAVVRLLAELQGLVARQRGAGILAVFSSTQHDAPLAAAREMTRRLHEHRCRVVVHVANVLVRRTDAGKLVAYGPELDHTETWLPTAPFTGLLLTASAARASSAPTKPAEIAGFHREAIRDRTDATDTQAPPSFVAWRALVRSCASAIATRPTLVGITGPSGIGKSRMLAEIASQLEALDRRVVRLRIGRRFDGDGPEDERVLAALHGPEGLERYAGELVLAIDDADRLSARLQVRLVGDLRFSRIVTSTRPLFEAAAHATDRIALALAPLAYDDAAALLREQLEPARLIPDVLVERLALRGAGNPALLLALARDMKVRGAIRRHVDGEWFVAPDELDTLLSSPGDEWLATRALESLPSELAEVARACAVLGPRFCADELAYVLGARDVEGRLALLRGRGFLVEHAGWLEIADAALHDAIYELVPDRHALHARARDYWTVPRPLHRVGQLARLAYHAARLADHTVAAACYALLARAAQDRDEPDQAASLLDRTIASLADRVPPFARA